jgi:hypothetical protein
MTGLELSRAFFHEAVLPIVDRVAPCVALTAGRFGPRSDALGFDDAISRDHGWGPCCTLLFEPGIETAPIDTALRAELPLQFRGYSTSFRDSNMVALDAPPVEHDVELTTPDHYLEHALGTHAIATARDWLALDEQKLLEVTSGELFRDDLDYAAVRRRLAQYPDDVRLHLVAVEWTRILEEQAFPGRAASRGDELGAAIVTSRLAESVMRLGFYLERRYAPYAKWFGTAFRRLPCAQRLHEPLARLLVAPGLDERESAWASVLRALLEVHELHGMLTPGRYAPADVYRGRRGIGIPAFGAASIHELVQEIRAHITDPDVLALPPRLGSINQVLAIRDLEDGARRWRAWYLRA